ncbi:TetR/AcrR family transcriptional regulator [Crassaminicella thermophila]|uniref:TetR/AcrR family transcriptional regulator n=1 Tax=Crassaminicella thermophila TaxID=2599308 RepID=A0A5C0SCV0_CRATE|nr:TetR/AcrR family transcriptional regulator [Crassaminicella thermophila]QEK11278.1 TetR/AcrR family transcriptional regulator [Crassaminicella thermophila]
MARKTDPNKIEKVKKAAIEMTIEYGYRGASIASIAKRAGVSTGYLYRHYRSKEELVEELVDTYLKELKENFIKNFSQDKGLYEMIIDIVFNLFQLAKKDILGAKFIIALVFDISFDKESKKKSCEQLEIAQRIRNLGLKTKELNPKTTVEEVSVVIFTIPFMYLAEIIKKDNYEELLNEKFVRRVAEMCINALQ